jgi:3',5'-cyclic-AMP phosphodiesterase
VKIIQITDLHLVPDGRTLFDLSPERRLRQCIEDVNAQHADADLVVITGDLAHNGEPPMRSCDRCCGDSRRPFNC